MFEIGFLIFVFIVNGVLSLVFFVVEENIKKADVKDVGPLTNMAFFVAMCCGIVAVGSAMLLIDKIRSFV